MLLTTSVMASAFDVLVLVGSLGAEAPILSILKSLPHDFDTPIVVMQHLPPSSELADFYGERVPFEVKWLDSASSLRSRQVLVCPSRSFVEVLPNGSFLVRPRRSMDLERTMDVLLESVARSYAHRAIAVVLTGMGNDAAAGARELHQAGGRVVVQSESSATSAEMPRAAIAAGAADLVVDVADIAQVVSEIIKGTPRPKARSELEAVGRIFGTAGEIAARAKEIDWALTPLGPAISWSPELRMMARSTVESAHPTAIWWGPDLIQIYNEPWRQFLGASKHPEALGRAAKQTWSEIWDDIGPMVDRVMKLGEPTGGEDHLIVIDRHGYAEEVYFTFAYSPIRDASGAVVGVNHTADETTSSVVASRRLRILRALAASVVGANTPREACEKAGGALAGNPMDLPFVLVYLFDRNRRQATLAGSAGMPAGSPMAPHICTPPDERRWPFQRVLDSGEPVVVRDLHARGLPADGAGSALLLPLRTVAGEQPVGVLIAGLGPHRPFDDAYRTFLELVAQHISSGMLEARAKELGRERAERLEDLDRSKIDFFANVSHELRTPLTLVVTPLERILEHRADLPASAAEELEIAARSSRRLVRLVDDLLDFSQVEQRRQRAPLETTDLAALTNDIASAFRSAIESAGLTLRVNIDNTLPLVPVNRDMWERIVSNLLSNALKFTFEGMISVTLHALALHAELVVSDTGVGIPADEVPNAFKRFHRAQGTRSRTVEGLRIGLSIVNDLVARMGGQLTLNSAENKGTTFTIWLPYKSHRQIVEQPAVSSAHGAIATELADEASRWAKPTEQLPGDTKRGSLLVVDDSADLRDYLRRLLSPQWNVMLAANVPKALDLVRTQKLDIVLTDVTMSGLDGFSLLRQIREDPRTKSTPVIFLTARAGEQAAIDGLVAGADDYITKPFSPRELVARVRAQVELSRTRRRADEARTASDLADTQELQRISRLLLGADENALYEELLGSTRALMRSHCASIQMLSQDRNELIVLAHHGFAPESAEHWKRVGATDPTSCAVVLSSRDRVNVPDVEAWDLVAGTPDLEAFRKSSIRSVLSLPLIARDGQMVGVLSTYWQHVHAPTDREYQLFDVLARQAADLIERRLLQQALRDSEQRFRSLFEESKREEHVRSTR